MALQLTSNTEAHWPDIERSVALLQSYLDSASQDQFTTLRGEAEIRRAMLEAKAHMAGPSVPRILHAQHGKVTLAHELV